MKILPLFLLLTVLPAQAAPVKIFILADQSNMEGKAKITLLDHQHSDPEIQKLLPGLSRKGDSWSKRDDVFIDYLDRHGPLTTGYGSPERIGPELAFGLAMGEHYHEPVLIIKTAWGGKSLYRDFRPLSSGLPDEAALQTLLEEARKKKPETTFDEIESSFGHYYRLMLEQIYDTLGNFDKQLPALKGYTPELSGFFWFQGFNDMINQTAVDEYSGHMANFIRDVRKDLNSPQLPFVIGVLGVGGPDDKDNERKNQFKKNQAAPASLSEFKGNVIVFPTDEL